MRAMLIPRFGSPDVFEEAEMPDPVAGDGQVVIDVEHIGVNFSDIRNRRGDGMGIPPMVVGIEVSGVVSEVGSGVDNGLAVGMPVTALTGGHAYAEAVAVDARRVLPLPDNLVGDPMAATVMAVVPSALSLLTTVGKVQPDETMLIHGASGGVGTALVQIANALGLGPVHGTVGSEFKADYARRYDFAGVHLRSEFVEAIRQATGGRGVDVVFDPIGGVVRARSFDALAPLGRLIHFGNASLEPEVAPPALDLRARALGYIGYSGGQQAAWDFEGLQESWRRGLEMVADGRVRMDVTVVLPLDQVAEAHRMIEAGEVVGKVVLSA